MSSFWTLVILSIAFSCSIIDAMQDIEAKQDMKLPSAVIIGAVQCDTCIKQSSPEANYRFISGASVAVICGTPGFRHIVKTNKSGNFEVHLPYNLKQLKECSIELISSNQPLCTMAAKQRTTLSSLRLKSRKGTTFIFSAGVIKFKPMRKPEICDQKPTGVSLKNDEELLPTAIPSDNTVRPAVEDPKFNPMNFEDYSQRLPQLPKLPPLPELPRLPPLPPLTFLPPMPRLPGFPFFHPMPGFPENPLTRSVFMPPFPFQPAPGFLPISGVSEVSSQPKTKSP